MRAKPFADAAPMYQRKGWSPLPLPAVAKSPPPSGWTGYAAPHPSGADVAEWASNGHAAGNIGLRTPQTLIGIDVDAYDGKPGLQTMLAAIERLGPLPRSPRSTSRPDDRVSGIRFYRVPGGRRWADKWPGVEFIHYGHRYAVAWPSVHPEGRIYQWYSVGGELLAEPPAVTDFPELPAAWVAELDRTEARTADTGEGYAGPGYTALSAPAQAAVDSWTTAAVAGVVDELTASATWPEGDLHQRSDDDEPRGWEKLQADAAYRLGRLGRAGWNRLTLEQARAAFVGAAPTCATWTPADVAAKWLVQSQRGTPADYPETLRAESDWLATLPGDTDPQSASSAHDVIRQRFPRLDLAALLSADRPPRDWVVDGLIPAGASVALVAPAGAGKSLLMLACMIAVARGDVKFAGLGLARRRRVLLVDMENTEDDLADRLAALGVTVDGVAALDDLVLVHLPPLAALDTALGGMELAAVLDAYDVKAGDVVVLDSLQRVVNGPESDSDTMRAYYRHSGVMLKRRVTVIRTDNTGKDADRGARGSSGKRDDVDVELIVTADTDNPGRLTIKPGKIRLAGIPSVIVNRDDDEDGLLTFTTAGDPFRALVADAHILLEQLEIPVEAGERKALETIKDNGRNVVRAALRVAIKERKAFNVRTISAPCPYGAPPAENEPPDRAAQPRRSTAQSGEKGESERENRAAQPRRSPAQPDADAHSGGAPPPPPSLDGWRRPGASEPKDKTCPDCGGSMSSAPSPGCSSHDLHAEGGLLA